ncbi:enoyl-CoA hydratase [compost metagenome]
MLLLGEPVDARTAQELGLVNRVIEDDALLPTALAVAESVAALPHEAVLQTKALLKLNTPDLAERMDRELEVFNAQLRSPAFREIATAFMEKRKPDPACWQ